MWHLLDRIKSRRGSIAPDESLGSGLGQEEVERLKEGCAVGYEPAVKIDQTNKFPQLPLGGWLREIANRPDFVFQRTNAGGVHMMTEEIQRGTTEQTLCHVDQNAVIV